MNKEQIRKINSDLNDGRIAVSQATEKILELFEEIESKAYEAGMTEMFYSFRYNTGVKEITKDFINKRFDQWKESQKKDYGN